MPSNRGQRQAVPPLRLVAEGYGSKIYVSANNMVVKAAKNELARTRHERERTVLEVLRPLFRYRSTAYRRSDRSFHP